MSSTNTASKLDRFSSVVATVSAAGILVITLGTLLLLGFQQYQRYRSLAAESTAQQTFLSTLKPGDFFTDLNGDSVCYRFVSYARLDDKSIVVTATSDSNRSLATFYVFAGIGQRLMRFCSPSDMAEYRQQ